MMKKADNQELYYFVPSHVRAIMHTLRKNGNKAYVVGGCMRDYFMGKAKGIEIIPKDWDIATDLLPQEGMELFAKAGFKTEPSGIDYGTISVIAQGEMIEITTFRTEKAGCYLDGRRPDEVEFSKTIEEDLSRRDFTMNAIAYSLVDGIADPFNGIDDIEKGILQCVGNPMERLEEDILRVLRGVRFACKYDLSLGYITRAIYRCAHLIGNVSMERYNLELFKILETSNSAKGVKFLIDSELLTEKFIYNSQKMYELFDKLDNSCETYQARKGQAKFGLLCTLLENAQDNVIPFCNRLKISKRGRKIYSTLVQESIIFSGKTTDTKSQLGRIRTATMDLRTFLCLKDIFYNEWHYVLKLQDNNDKMHDLNDEDYFYFVDAQEYLKWFKVASKSIKNNLPLTRFDLDINGNQIKSLLSFGGINWRPLKIITDALVELVHNDPTLNNNKDLIKYTIISHEKLLLNNSLYRKLLNIT